MGERIWISDAADKMGVGVTTVRGWCDMLDIAKARDDKGRRVLTPDEYAALEVVKALRQEGDGLDTIQRKIGGQSDASDDATEAPARRTDAADARADRREMVAEIIEAMEGQAGLAEKYARAAHEIGTLQERVRGLERLLSDASDARAEAAELKRERDELAEKVKRLEGRRWWKW
jgi:DNA-binding transcriptional MerR regulator